MNIINYVNYYNEASFQAIPFNEVDNLVFCALSSISWQGIITNRPITLAKAIEKRNATKPIDKYNQGQLLKALAIAKRYNGISLSHYVNYANKDEQTQFCALTICYQPFKYFIAFRGTDNKLYSWKEDFNMSFDSPVPSQKLAVKYLNDTIKFKPLGKFIIAGHSKGGNLAIYSSANCSYKKRIVQIYNNDGPGFTKEFIDSSEYQSIADKALTIKPQSSLVSNIMLNTIKSKTVLAKGRFISQHNMYNWQVDGTKFEEGENTNTEVFYEQSLSKMYNQLTKEQKSLFVNTFYDIFLSINLETTEQLLDHKVEILKQAAKKFGQLDKDDRLVFLKMTKLITLSTTESFIDTFVKKKGNVNDENINS